MIIGAERTHENGCLITRKKTRLCENIIIGTN